MTDSLSNAQDTLLLVEPDVLVRSSLAAYLRKCGYVVIEALAANEALRVLSSFAGLVSIVLSDAAHGFVISQWVKQKQPHVSVIMTGSVDKAISAAAELCDDGPHAKRPHDPQLLADEIRRNLAQRRR